MIKKTILLIAFYFVVPSVFLRAQAVRAWEEALVLPTYLVEPPEPNPIFFPRSWQS